VFTQKVGGFDLYAMARTRATAKASAKDADQAPKRRMKRPAAAME